MNSTNRPQDPKEFKLAAMDRPESDDRFDQELAEWLPLHGEIWSGTADELVTAVRSRVNVTSSSWLQSPRELFKRIESHEQVLRSLGVAVSLPPAYPRRIALQSCSVEEAAKVPSDASVVNAASSQQASTTQPDAKQSQPQNAGDGAAETFYAMLKAFPVPASGKPSTLSKLAAAPAHLRTVVKKAWLKRAGGM